MDTAEQSRPVEFTVEHLLKLLQREDLLTQEQVRRVQRQESRVRTKILREQVSRHGQRRGQRYQVSPDEVVAHFGFTAPDGRAVDEDRIMRTVADDAGFPFVRPDPLEVDMDLVAGTLSQPFARHHSCVPLRRENGKLVIAVNDPYDRELLRDLRDVTDEPVAIVVSPKSVIHKLITEIYGLRSSLSAAEQEASIGVDIGNLEQLVELKDVEELDATDQPVVKAVEYLLHYAFDQRASDIHIEPKREHTVVRLRIDGVLHNIYTFPRAVHRPFVSRLKMLARMDISEKRRPQDGRIKTERNDREIELRVSTVPVAFGEKAVIRIFDPQALIQDLDDIGFASDDLKTWRELIGQPDGLILVSGPTGSGKTTTLYSTLRELAGPRVNITTIEDPVEMVCEEFNQVQVQEQIDVDFASALRNVLRQDPDIVMVGEIRDQETAEMAVQAALTGHLVFSTVHTNDAASTVTRMLELGVEPFLLSSTLVGVMAQRLVRTICEKCRTETQLNREQTELLGLNLPPRSDQTLPVEYGEGCTHCRGTGYLGRTGVFELLPVDDNVRRLISREADATKIRKAARAEGVKPLREAAIRKLANGETTFEEVLTIASDARR
ncbi:MAG: GspE/PulE family protein [Bradymonadaceae bacterium]